jgi:enamine deaminase RidA (YjgF/YER057c/UK114 family)
MEILITKEYEEFSKKYQFTPAIKKNNRIYTSAIFGSIFKMSPDFIDDKSSTETVLSKIGKIKIGKGCVNQARIILFHLEELLKAGGAKLSDVVSLNISFMHSVSKSDMIPALQVIKSAFKGNIPTYTLGRMDFPALKGVLIQIGVIAEI